MSKKIEESVMQLVAPAAAQLGYEVVDVEYVKKKNEDSELIIYIDREGGVDLDDCEACSIAIDPLIDAADPIEESYILCVSSPGIDRPLKRPRDFEKHMGEAVDVKLYEKLNGEKEFVAVLRGYDQGKISLDIGEDELLELEGAKIALIRPHIDF
ncbi:MAG: ribosome maturation factor [Clostridiales bacterium]|nr:MAG: ribosome maturation factor [Clostridiales bacterium]